MFFGRLIEVLLDWLHTGRFPREEFRLRPVVTWLFAAVVLVLVSALLIHALAVVPALGPSAP